MVKKIHYIDIDDENEKEYWIAVHTTCEGFQLAYFINNSGLLKLRRSDNDIKNFLNKGVFNIFEFTDKFNHKYCHLISNKCVLENFLNSRNNNTLFNVPERNELYLLKEFRQVDFFIKSNDKNLHDIINKELLMLPMVTLSYVIPEKKIINKNLCFTDEF
ncbi:MAG: IPExxxVDY family protein [Flavobacteriaceae bacterium]